MKSPIGIFQSIPRLSVAPLNTPIQRLRRIEEVIPELPELYIKRDDYIGPLVWGNKLRKLEFVFADAKKKGADTLITCGGIQSNHARTTAQSGKSMGFETILVLNGIRPLRATGNLLIDYKVGAEVVFVETRDDRRVMMETIAKQKTAQGKRVYQIPLGASDPVGTLGFIGAMEELYHQQKAMGIEFDYLFHPSSSGGTQAGLEVGKRLFGMKTEIIGISADDPSEEIRATISRIANPVIDRLEMNLGIHADDLKVDDHYIGQGYGIPSEGSLEAEKIFGEREGILLDHFYTAKAASALIAYARKGMFKPTDKVLLWHTGGTISLFQ